MQITRTTPLRLMILQLRQIRLTDASTFIFALSLPVLGSIELLGTEHDTCTTQIIRRQLYRHLVTRQDADVVHPHLSRNMSQHNMPVFQFHSKRGIRQILQNLALHLNNVVFCHAIRCQPWRSARRDAALEISLAKQ